VELEEQKALEQKNCGPPGQAMMPINYQRITYMIHFMPQFPHLQKSYYVKGTQPGDFTMYLTDIVEYLLCATQSRHCGAYGLIGNRKKKE
jgi:hypothetical protein